MRRKMATVGGSLLPHAAELLCVLFGIGIASIDNNIVAYMGRPSLR